MWWRQDTHSWVLRWLVRPLQSSGGSTIQNYFPKAFMVVAEGLAAAAIGYSIALRRPLTRVKQVSERLDIDDQVLLRWSRWLAGAGALIIALVYLRVGYIPLLSAAPGQARYLTADISSSFQQYEWLINRGMDFLTDSLPVVLVWAIYRHESSNTLTALLGVLALLMPLRRANLISVIITVLVMEFLKTGKLRKRYIAIVIAASLSYGASQLVFFNLIGVAPDTSEVLGAVGSALPEVRDLGWVMSLSDEKWGGVTFVQALLPVPSFVSDFSQTYSLRQVTTRIIGMDQDGQTGGLRLTLAGESYFNFGYTGVVIVCALFGAACAALDVAIELLRKGKGMVGLYISSLLFGWLCFWLYLGGTQAAATIKIGLVVTIGMLFLSRVTPSRGISAGAPRYNAS